MTPCVVLFLLAAATQFETTFRNGLLALQQGDLAAAQTNLEAARKLEPQNGRVWVALSQTYWRQHKTTEADAAANKAFALAPADPVVLKSLGIYYFEVAEPLLKEQKFAQAAAILERAKPKTAQLELALGVAYYGLRRFDEAADAFLRTIKLEPETEQPYLFLGRIVDQIPTRLPQAAERFAQFEAAHPASAAGYLLHAKALNAQSLDPETVLTLLDKSLSIDSTDASAHFERGTVLDRLKRFEEAAAEFEQATALNPTDPAAHYRLARDYERLGKHEAAQTEREKHAKLVKARDTM
jgi:tetratricopeptide (TPR) repeat protein